MKRYYKMRSIDDIYIDQAVYVVTAWTCSNRDPYIECGAHHESLVDEAKASITRSHRLRNRPSLLLFLSTAANSVSLRGSLPLRRTARGADAGLVLVRRWGRIRMNDTVDGSWEDDAALFENGWAYQRRRETKQAGSSPTSRNLETKYRRRVAGNWSMAMGDASGVGRDAQASPGAGPIEAAHGASPTSRDVALP